jgi:hypothetical protein
MTSVRTAKSPTRSGHLETTNRMSDYDAPTRMPVPTSEMEYWLRSGRMREWAVDSKATLDQPLETRFAEFMAVVMQATKDQRIMIPPNLLGFDELLEYIEPDLIQRCSPEDLSVILINGTTIRFAR